MKYTLTKVLTSSAVSKSGRTGSPIIGYVLWNNETNKKEIFNKCDAYSIILLNGATNVEAKIREEIIDGEEQTIHYLKPTDGTKINQYMISVD